MINGLDIYYSKNIGLGLKPVSKTASGLKLISKKTASGLKPISKGGSCNKNWNRVKNIYLKNMMTKFILNYLKDQIQCGLIMKIKRIIIKK